MDEHSVNSQSRGLGFKSDSLQTIGLHTNTVQKNSSDDRLEILVLRLRNLVQAHARMSRVQLQIERGRIHRFLFITREFCETVGKGDGNAKTLGAAFRDQKSRCLPQCPMTSRFSAPNHSK